MSTGYNCEIRELAVGSWYYVLQRGDCPVGAWDWREYANIIGPFPSSDAALEAMLATEANPGGYTEIKHGGTPREADLLARARAPRQTIRWGMR